MKRSSTVAGPDAPDVPPAGWVGQLLRPRPAPIPWALAIRCPIAVVTPLAIAMSVGQLGVGIVLSIGALAGSSTDQGGPYRQRVVRWCIVVFGGVCGFLLGGLVHGHPVAAVTAIILAGIASGLVSVLGNNASVGGLQFLIYAAITSSVDLTSGGPAWLAPVLFLAGAVWSLLLMLAGSIGRARVPERIAVARVYRTLAELIRAVGSDAAETRRQDLTAALNAAYDAVGTWRMQLSGHSGEFRKLLVVLNAATPAVEAATALTHARHELPTELADASDAIANAVQYPSAHLRPAVPDPERNGRRITALRDGLRAAADRVNSKPPGPPDRPRFRSTLVDRLRSVRDKLLSGRVTWLAIIRLALCLGVAEALEHVLPLQHAYWVTLTVAVALKPDFGSVFARSVQRGLGTVVGVLIGSAVLAFLPYGAPTLIAMAAFTFFMPIAVRRNYGLFATFITPVVVLQLDLANTNYQPLVLARLIDTLIGCAVVLVIGYLPWPDTWRPRRRIGAGVADATDQVRDYLIASFGEDEEKRTSTRRRTYRTLSDLRTTFQQTMSEPPPISSRAIEWWPAIVALERVTDATTDAVLQSQHGGAVPPESDVERLAQAMTGLAAAIRTGTRPTKLKLPDDEALAGIASELTVAQAVLAGPDGR